MMQQGESIQIGRAIVRCVKRAEPMGEYKPTGLDKEKKNADFLVIGFLKSRTTIKWKCGKIEHVTDAKLNKLQAVNTWLTDF